MDKQVIYTALLGIQTIVADRSEATEDQRFTVDLLCNRVRELMRDDLIVNLDALVNTLQTLNQLIVMSGEAHFDYMTFVVDIANEAVEVRNAQ